MDSLDQWIEMTWKRMEVENPSQRLVLDAPARPLFAPESDLTIEGEQSSLDLFSTPNRKEPV
jgi:hypothetical protein